MTTPDPKPEPTLEEQIAEAERAGDWTLSRQLKSVLLLNPTTDTEKNR